MPRGAPLPYNGGVSEHRSREEVGWPVGARLLEALSRRDFGAVGTCLDEGVHFRALLPPTVVDVDGPGAVVACFEKWFGGTDDFEVLDAEIGAMGPRLTLRWRIRMSPPGAPHEGRVAEQHVFATVRERVEVLDLLCSGFVSERTLPAPEEAARR